MSSRPCRNLSLLPMMLLLCLVGCDAGQTISGPIVPAPTPTNPNPGTGTSSKISGSLTVVTETTDDAAFSRTEVAPAGINVTGGRQLRLGEPPPPPRELIIDFTDKDEFQRFNLSASNESFSKTSVCNRTMSHLYAVRLKKDETPEGQRRRFDVEFAKVRAELKAKYDGKVEVYPNYIRTIQGTDPYQSIDVNDWYYKHQYQWHYDAIKVPGAWQAVKEVAATRPIIIAVIDTGVKKKHFEFARPDLFVDGYDFVRDVARANDGDGRDNDPEDPGDGKQPSFHGTHVIGTIAAMMNNGTDYEDPDNSEKNGGVTGIAPNVQIMPLRALGIGGGDDLDIEAAILYAAGLDNESGKKPARAADIISMSIGGPGESPRISSAVAKAIAKGLIVIAAAGNDDSANLSIPASLNDVIAVGAVTRTHTADDNSFDLSARGFPFRIKRSFYSNKGRNVELMAPGGETQYNERDGVFSTLWQRSQDPITGKLIEAPDYAFYQGTSMATPHLSAVVALMKTVNPEMTLRGARSILYATAVKPEELVRRDASAFFYGHGMIDAEEAVKLAQRLAKSTPIELTLLVTDVKSGKVIKLAKTRTTDNYAFVVDGLPAGEYTLSAGADLNGNQKFCEIGELCGTYNQALKLDGKTPQDNISFTVSMVLEKGKALTPAMQ